METYILSVVPECFNLNCTEVDSNSLNELTYYLTSWNTVLAEKLIAT
jgi:hypothetical protein